MKKIFALLFGATILGITTPALACDAGISAGVLAQCAPSGTLAKYAEAVLNDNFGYIILIAIVLIVFSGLQYMFAVGQAAEQAKAKQRVIGILGGIAFYFVIDYVLKILF